ncbi:MAG: TraR/DksA C4-type zinc finger protein [Aliivibrio sp.]|uniref:TraR/DksA C4-type zinc finger protein n=1 Tax=Aliivibrio sp. TaxID=1872443 RepID=UPI001A3E8E33|nr:TraR/DksA C4-type zinc finger protein [Aliivibrio sp.]
MTDAVDQASTLEQLQRDNALQANQQHETPLIINGIRRCLACEETILTARINAVNAVRCINCQELHEHQQKHFVHKGTRTGRQF